MGLGEFTGSGSGAASSSNSSSSSSSSSGSSGYRTVREPPANPGPDDFPIHQAVCPEYVILENDEGELELVSYPETEPIWLAKDWYSDQWSLDTRPEGWKRIWYSRRQFLNHKYIVEQESGKDLYEELKRDPEAGLDLLRDCANRHGTEKSGGQPSSVVCNICGEKHSYLSGEYRTIDNKQVCSNHTVDDLHHAELI